MTLWTQAELTAARNVYKRAGPSASARCRSIVSARSGSRRRGRRLTVGAAWLCLLYGGAAILERRWIDRRPRRLAIARREGR